MVDHEGGVAPGDLPQTHGEAVLVHPVLDADDGDPELVEVAGLLRHEVGPPEPGRLDSLAGGAGEPLTNHLVLPRAI